MEEFINWLNTHKISYRTLDSEVVEVECFGKLLFTPLVGVKSIFRENGADLVFNLTECTETLLEEGIYHVAFKFGKNYYYYDIRGKFGFNILKYIGKRQTTLSEVKYVNLGIHTPYELLNGSGDLNEWVKKAKYLGHEAIGICDLNTMAATLHLQKECIKAGIRPVIGYTTFLKVNEEKIEIKIYCQSQEGLQNLLRIQKAVMVDSEDHTLNLSVLMEYVKGNAVVFGKRSSYWLKKNLFIVRQLQPTSDGLFYQVDLNEYKADRIDTEVLEAIKYYFEHFYIRDTCNFIVEPILICDNYYLDRGDARNKIILNKIAYGASHEQSEEQYYKDIDEIYSVFSPLFDPDKWDVESLFERMCRHTTEIAEHAQASFETGRMFMPEYIMLPDEAKRYGNRHNMFLSLLEEGLLSKVEACKQAKYRERLAEEIYVVESTNNIDYFLVQWDIIKYAYSQGIVTGIGRGSAGGCLIAYLLGITSIDPIEYDLLFSRFLVPERSGLIWDNRTKITRAITLPPGADLIELTLNGHKYKFDKDAMFLIGREQEILKVYADELQPGDELLFDQRDLLWVLNKKNE